MTDYQFNVLFRCMATLLKGVGFILIVQNGGDADLCYKKYNADIESLKEFNKEVK